MQRGKVSDDVVLVAWSRVPSYDAIRVYVEVASSLGLNIILVTTKFTLVGTTVSDENKCPLAVDYGFIEWNSFIIWGPGYLISDDGRVGA